MAGQLRKHDIGSVIRVRVLEHGHPFNASTATLTQYKLKRPSGTVAIFPASFETDGVNGIFVYTTVEDDLSESGPWSGQVYMEFGSAGKWHTDIFTFQVGDNLS